MSMYLREAEAGAGLGGAELGSPTQQLRHVPLTPPTSMLSCKGETVRLPQRVLGGLRVTIPVVFRTGPSTW